MARAQIKYVVTDQRSGKVIQNAKVFVQETGTSTAVTDLFAALTGGAAIVGGFLTSNAQGEVEGYVTTPRNVRLKVTDNGDTAFYPATPGNTLSFADFNEDPTPAYEDPVEEEADDAALIAEIAARIAADTLLIPLAQRDAADGVAILDDARRVVAKNDLLMRAPDGSIWVTGLTNLGMITTDLLPWTGADLYAVAQLLASEPVSAAPVPGGALTANSVALGSIDYRVATGPVTVSAFTAADWFTANEDTHSAWIVVNGNLTINAGQVFKPVVRKLFTVVYVTGNLVVNGEISMTRRGANHSGTGTSGGATTAAAIRIATGTFSGVLNPQVPAAGAAGGAAVSGATNPNAGAAGAAGGTGGGSSGTCITGTSGAGAAGTSFSGGPGGGGVRGAGVATAGGANGGRGGNAAGPDDGSGGGAGNPAGTPVGTVVEAAEDGTGGVLIIIVEGTYSGSGSVTAGGARGGLASGSGGGSSGGGSITVLAAVDAPGPVPTAPGGVRFASGGAGTARKLVLV